MILRLCSSRGRLSHTDIPIQMIALDPTPRTVEESSSYIHSMRGFLYMST